MYTNSFYIDKNIGNNALSFAQRVAKHWTAQLYVPALKTISDISEITLLNTHSHPEKITFEDVNFDDILTPCYGLENFYELDSPFGKNLTWKIPKMYLFDNHNHALFFWYLAKHNWEIHNNSTLYHIDEHADYRDPWEYFSDGESDNLETVFQYTNFSKINVWNYIIPAEKDGLISKTIQIRSTVELENYNSPSLERRGLGGGLESGLSGGVILNIDLDFFQPDLDFIDYDLKKNIIHDIMQYADVITVATSPFFIDQKLALNVFKDLFYKW